MYLLGLIMGIRISVVFNGGWFLAELQCDCGGAMRRCPRVFPRVGMTQQVYVFFTGVRVQPSRLRTLSRAAMKRSISSWVL